MHAVVAEAVGLERGFCCEALSVALVGMNAGAHGPVHRVRGRPPAGGRSFTRFLLHMCSSRHAFIISLSGS